MRKNLNIVKISTIKCFFVFFQSFFLQAFAEIPKSLLNPQLPILSSGPPLNIQAAYDKEVLLEVTPGDDFSSQNSNIVWSINNKKICTGLYCPIILKENEYQDKAPVLQIITYNEFGGTTYTYEFDIRSKEGFDPKELNKLMDYVKPKQNKNDSFSSQQVSAIYGKGTLIQSDYILYIGSLSRSFVWNDGIFQTDNLDTLRISDSESGVLFLLPSSNLSIETTQSDEQMRTARLNYGGLRVKASGNRNDTDANTENFTNKINIYTAEVNVLIPRGSDVVITRDKENGKLFTRLLVFSGDVTLIPSVTKSEEKQKNSDNSIKLTPGLEFTIFEDGSVLPLATPKSSTIDNYIALTTTQDELKQRFEIKNIDGIGEILDRLDRAAVLADNEEFFELLNLLTPIQNQMDKDIRIPYYLGFAKKGLYQNQDAKKYFQYAEKMDPNYPMAHWQLGLIYLEEKNYEKAENEFLLAKKNIPPESKIAHEYEYYVGVPYYFNNKLVFAKNAFQTAVWDTELDPSLRQSAADFLKKINIEKPWTLIIPFGIQYDANALSLAQNQSLPNTYSDKSVFRAIMGGIYSYDTIKESNATGWFLGGAGKLFYVKNLTNGYSNLDAIVAEGSIYESYRWEKDELKKETDSVRIYQSGGAIFVDNTQDTLYFLGGGVYKNLELNAGVQIDVSSRTSSNQRSGLVYNQYYLMGLGQIEKFVLDLNLQGQEILMFNTSDTVGSSLELIATPAATYAIDSKLSLKFGNTFDFLFTFISPIQSKFKFTPTAAANYFILDWLIGTFSAYYEYTRVVPDNSDIFRPGLSLMVTGIF
ncbi:tetratricopeptide repeat protein [Pigmentibacter sp. JX0631]|uniref:tetratricopeptide repeat protein n=1 Tax=Pigmentibacter sp. JX0631 TaxID=2976982 RepID=UPI002468928C|nr:tetratricopeptide repeat protein [Pigmentibacter sp. JX0631]WGL58997.1 tetratricopeptide repeat protein [Pigmentibacter sp. JX0631]